MIRTVTLNTGFDEVFTVSAIQPGGVMEVRGAALRSAAMLRIQPAPTAAMKPS
jgi:hypothetical protein